MIYAVLIAIIAAGAGGFWGGLQWEEGRWAAAESKRIAAEKKVAEQARELEQQAANNLIDMDAAYQAGEAKAKVVVKTIYARGQDYAANDKGLSNPACVMSGDSLRFLRTTLAGMRSPADPGGSPATVPRAGTAGSGNVQRAVSPDPAEYGAVGPVHPNAGQAGDGGQVQGPSLRPPKPVPRAAK